MFEINQSRSYSLPLGSFRYFWLGSYENFSYGFIQIENTEEFQSEKANNTQRFTVNRNLDQRPSGDRSMDTITAIWTSILQKPTTTSPSGGIIRVTVKPIALPAVVYLKKNGIVLQRDTLFATNVIDYRNLGIGNYQASFKNLPYLGRGTGCEWVDPTILTLSLGRVSTKEIETPCRVNPNPFTNVMKIDCDCNDMQYTLIDILGRVIKQGDEKEIITNNLPSGFYFLSLDCSERRRVVRVVKE